MDNYRILNEDISLEIAQYLDLEAQVNMSQTCKLWYWLSHRYARFWTSTAKAIPPAHFSRFAPLSEQTPKDIRKAALRTVKSHREWYTAEVVRPHAVVHLDVDFARAHVVPGTKWMLVLPLKTGDIPPQDLVMAVKCYDLISGSLVGDFGMAFHTTAQAFAPEWHTSVAVSSTEIVVGLERYCKWSQYSTYYVQRIRLSLSPETEEIIFTVEPMSLVTNNNCAMEISHDGRFFSLDDSDCIFVYKTDGSTVPWEFQIESRDNRCVSLHGDMLVVMTDKTLDVSGIHLPSLLKNWPEHFNADDPRTLPSRSVGETEGSRLLFYRKLDFTCAYKAAIFDPLDQPNSINLGDALHFDIVYMEGDHCFVLPIKAEVTPEDGGDGLQTLKKIEPTAVETEIATLPKNARTTRFGGHPWPRTLAWSEQDPATQLQKHSMHVIGVDKPGVIRSLAPLSDHQDMDYATIISIDEVSRLVLMQDARNKTTDAPLLVVWI